MSEPTSPLVHAYIEKAVKTKSLEVLAFGMKCTCGENHMGSGDPLQMLKAYIVPTFVNGATEICLKWYCPAEMKREIRYPSTWWDAIKDRFLPQFARQWIAIGYTTHRVWEMFPEIEWPKHMGHKLNVFVTTGELDL